jgi:para-nitrobenzyl esterase
MKKRHLWTLFCVLIVSAVVLSGFQQNPGDKNGTKEKHDPFAIVKVDGGMVSGEVVTEEDGKVLHIFRGVPYAAPPVGNLRWRPPQKVENWKGVLDCTEWAPMAQQPDASGSSAARGGIDEDCLHLNIVTPAQKDSDRFPVMVFFHGGGLATHTGNSNTYNNTALPMKGVVVVTVNSRLGPLGYMAHPALTEESEYGASGNYGTMDLVASLKWIRKNIKAFGGDPKNVTIFEESGGGTKTLSVMTTPFGKGLFHKAIIESGDGAINPAGRYPLANSEAAGVNLQEALGITEGTHEDVLAAMRAKTWEEIIEAGGDSGFSPRLTIDGHMLTDTVYNIFASGEQGKIPSIVGAQNRRKCFRAPPR